eukprot:CAMPEP_0181064866 /NCGR_PEP_ID=MMETSP1070-20121207/24424_1 /TAXON_ID=265543 /ORGANISM="Minutocellus polymorphus, Strain NH13" /LENGTH=35 /DNA_ID= /DNA_START= /DNA_END= /DNA_ORIENTATION=
MAAPSCSLRRTTRGASTSWVSVLLLLLVGVLPPSS